MEEELVNCWSSRQMAVIHLCVFFRGSVRFFRLRSPHGESFSLKTCSTVGYGLKKSFWKIKDKPEGFRCIVLRILLRSLSLRKKVLRTKVEKEKRRVASKGVPVVCGAENETRTRDPNLGKVVLYQLSYFRNGLKDSSEVKRRRLELPRRN